MNIIKMKVEDLIPYVNNPRNNENAEDKVASSIAEFGFKNPIIIDKNNVVINGHTRLLASKKLGLKEVPVIKADDLTEAQVKAFRITDNKTSEYAEWNEELLKLELEQLEEMDFNLDELSIDYSDFNMEVELDNFEGEYDEENDIIEEPPKVPFSKRQDIWLLGKHRLMCGDSTNEEDVNKLMGNTKAQMTFSDAPYNISFKGSMSNTTVNGVMVKHKGANQRHDMINNDCMSKEEFYNFMCKILLNIKRYVNGAWYLSFSSVNLEELLNPLRDNQMDWKSIIIWKKNQATLSMKDYKSRYEPIVYGRFDNSFYGKKAKEEDIWEYQRTLKNDLHPTMKPVPLICNMIEMSSIENDNILDLFGGSGSTLIASDITNRANYSMELDEKYVDVIVKRYINHKQNNGEDVYLLRDGNKIPYSEIEEEFNKEAE